MNHTELELERLVLEQIQRPKYRPAKPRVIAKQLNLPKESYRDVKQAIKRLAKKGKVSYAANHLVAPAAPTQNQITGVFQRTAAGYGFVRPTGTARSMGRDADIYVPAQRTLDASSGDVVLVRLKRRGRGQDKRLVGEITEIIERETHQFVGTYFEQAGSGYVRVDGNLFSQPIFVGDPGAKSAHPDDKVVIDMVRFPSRAHDGEAVITEVLGPRNRPGVDTLLITREFGLPEAFPEDVLEDARRRAAQFDDTVGSERNDLTHLTVITIDPEDARDFDDAISLERVENGHWRLGVHIADVSYFVPPKSPLDREAKKRGTSVYLPDRVIPMLPEIISNNLASLQPDRVRYAKTAFIELTEDGALVATETCSSAIKSRRRFTYEEVDDYLADRTKWTKKLAPDVHQLLGLMHELAMILRGRRRERGAIELTMPEVKLEIDRQGQVTGARRIENTDSHQIIEEFMLAANEAVAQMLRDRQLYFLRRIHESPDPRKLKALTDFIRELKITTDSLESRFEIQRVLDQVADRPERVAVNYAVLRSLQKAMYGPQEEGHFALASDCYCHFTSPIRRYPDLTVHRMLEAIERGATPASDFSQLLVLGEHCSEREQRAESAERELIKLKLLNFFSQRIGEEMDAVVTGVESFGLFVQGLELPAEGLIHIASLTDDYYDFDSTTHTLAGRRAGSRYRLGDTVRVEIARVDLDRRELDFRLLSKVLPETRPKSPSSGRARQQRKKSTTSRRSSAGKTSVTTRKAKAKGGSSTRKRKRG